MRQEEKKAFNREFWRFMWSSILIALSGCLGNVVDGIIVGNLIGEDGVSAINLSKPITQLMYTVNMLLATGAGMLVGIELGKKRYDRVATFYTLSMAGCLLFGLLETVGGLAFADGITGWFCAHEQLYEPTRDYFLPLLVGAPAYMVSWALATMVGVDGSPQLVSMAIVVDNAVNLLLDIVFIQVFGWGIEGSSTATVIGHVVGIVIMCRHFLYSENHLRLSLAAVRPAAAAACASALTLGSSLRQIVSQGAPLAVASVCLTALFYAANSIILSTMGRTGIFAFSVCMNVLYIYNLFLSGTCRTIQSLGAIQIGKADAEAFGLVLRKSVRFITVAMVITCLYIWIDPEGVSRLFGADEPELIAESTHALRVFALSFIPFCYIYVLMIVYKLYGHHQMALFISFALSLTVIPVLWVMARLAPELLWYSYLIAYAIEAALIVLFHYMSHIRLTHGGTP